MAMLFNLARMTTATTGAGATITLGAAVPGFLSFAQAGVVNGQKVSYGISDGTNSEVGEGIYTASGTTLTRTAINSTNANARINLSGNAQVYVTALADDILGAIVLNKQSIDVSYDIPDNLNGASVGPITIATGVVVTVPAGSRWMVS
jgi:hypothetical protein